MFDPLLDLIPSKKKYAAGDLVNTLDQVVLPPLDPSVVFINPGSDKLNVVDSRWVGHRLMQGSGALRLTKVNTRYLQYPIKVKNPAGDFDRVGNPI